MEILDYVNKKADKYISIYAPIAFIIVTFIIAISKIPFYDETQAFIISQLDLKEIFYLTRIEGHPILWYLILKPFSSLNLYPISMSIINWIFASIMILFLWKKAPFDNYIKFLITFSYPFFQYFGVVSRPYTLGVLIIFLLTYYYKDLNKKPILYSFLLVLCANISIITMFIAFAFGVIFIYKTIEAKNILKKDIILASLILCFGLLLILAQFLFVERPALQSEGAHLLFLRQLSYFLFAPILDLEKKNVIQILFQVASMISFYYFSYVFYKKDKSVFALCLLSFVPLIILFSKIYVGTFWHYFFFFVVFICALWICWEQIKNLKTAKILIVVLLILLLSPYVLTLDGKNDAKKPLLYKQLFNIISKKEYKNSKLFCFDNFTHVAPGLLLYLKKEGIMLYDNHNNYRTSYINIKNIRNIDYHTLNIEEFIQYLDKDKNNYLLGTTPYASDYKNFAISKKNNVLFFELVESYPEMNLTIFKISYKKT